MRSRGAARQQTLDWRRPGAVAGVDEAGRGPLAIDPDVPAGHRGGGEAPGLEEPAEKQPAIYA